MEVVDIQNDKQKGRLRVKGRPSLVHKAAALFLALLKWIEKGRGKGIPCSG